MKPETMRIWERGVGDSRLWGTLEHMVAITEMDAYRKELEAEVVRLREVLELALDSECTLTRTELRRRVNERKPAP